MEKLPKELTCLIHRFYNPYKNYYSKNVIGHFKQKSNYRILLRQLLSYNLYDECGYVISFQVDSILG